MNIAYENAKENDAYGIAYVSAHSWKETYSEILPDDYLDNRIKNIKESTIKTKEFVKNYPGEYIKTLAKEFDYDMYKIARYLKDVDLDVELDEMKAKIKEEKIITKRMLPIR